MQTTNQKKFRIEKVLRKKLINYMLNGKDMIIPLIIGLIKKKGCYIQLSQYFPKPYEPYGKNTNVVIYLIMHQNFF